jgi:uncharacterized repeat protein (TIGR01451 family)
MPWYVGAILVLVVALALGMGLLATAMYALVGVMLVSRLMARRWAADVAAERETNRLEARIGDTVAVVITLENRGRLPVVWALLEDLLPTAALIHRPPNLQVLGSRRQLCMLKPRGRRTIYYQLECNGRGYYQIGPLLCETGDLFGLHRRFRLLTEPHFLTVLPATVPLLGYEIASRRPHGEIRMTHRLFEDPTRLSGVRPYQSGDSFSRVHWKATAATGVLHSKTYDASAVAGATLLVDFHEASFPSRNEPYRSELAVTAAASIARALSEMNQPVGLITNGRDASERIRHEGWAGEAPHREAARRAAAMRDRGRRIEPLVVPTERGLHQLPRILRQLARLELADGLTLRELVRETACRMPTSASVLVVLTTVDEQSLVALTNLRRRGFSVSALVNVYEISGFSQAAASLMGAGIPARHLRDEAAVTTVCSQRLVGR